jgi:hypothetical protein
MVLLTESLLSGCLAALRAIGERGETRRPSALESKSDAIFALKHVYYLICVYSFTMRLEILRFPTPGARFGVRGRARNPNN